MNLKPFTKISFFAEHLKKIPLQTQTSNLKNVPKVQRLNKRIVRHQHHPANTNLWLFCCLGICNRRHVCLLRAETKNQSGHHSHLLLLDLKLLGSFLIITFLPKTHKIIYYQHKEALLADWF